MYSVCPTCGGGLRFLKNISYPDSESVRYENLVAYSLRQAMDKAGIQMLNSGLKMRLTFLFPMPDSRQHRPGAPCPGNGCKKLHTGDSHTQRPDLDNCIKSILDGGNGVLYADDDVICELSARKIWASEGKTEIIVETLS